MLRNNNFLINLILNNYISKKNIFDVSYKRRLNPKIIDHDPPYILKSRLIPVYDALQIKLTSYDFVILENYSKFIHKWLKRRKYSFDNYPIPNTSQTLSTYVPRSIKIHEELKLNNYCRVFNVYDLETTKFPLLMEIFMQMQPEGVEFSIDKPSKELEKFRYVPELEKDILKEQLELIESNKQAGLL